MSVGLRQLCCAKGKEKSIVLHGHAPRRSNFVSASSSARAISSFRHILAFAFALLEVRPTGRLVSSFNGIHDSASLLSCQAISLGLEESILRIGFGVSRVEDRFYEPWVWYPRWPERTMYVSPFIQERSWERVERTLSFVARLALHVVSCELLLAQGLTTYLAPEYRLGLHNIHSSHSQVLGYHVPPVREPRLASESGRRERFCDGLPRRGIAA